MSSRSRLHGRRHTSRLAREVAILDAVVRSARLPNLKTIAETVDLPASTTHRIVGALCEEGLLRRSPWNTYLAGPRLQQLVALAEASQQLLGTGRLASDARDDAAEHRRDRYGPVHS
jgi:DNA-binding IclR family transcriptional regulator